ncbi:hypothetical protein G6F56_008212 [Rhizopus delemar]|nr:hypothetical protein G6F56_008212 [Rhizopus delemar]
MLVIAFIVSSSTDGRVALSSVKVQFVKDKDQDWKIKKVSAESLYEWFNDNMAIPTLLKMCSKFDEKTSSIGIVVSKGTFVYMTLLQIANDGTVSIKEDWKSYSMKHTGVGLTGGTWESENDFRGYTFEGEGIRIRLENGVLEEDTLATYQLNQRLIQKYRQQWMEEQLKTEEEDVFGSSDAHPCLWGASDGPNKIITALYCTMKPTVDIHYRLESAEDSVIAFILQKERGTDIESICSELNNYVHNPDFFFTCPLQGILRELVEYLVDGDSSEFFFIWLKKLQEFISLEPAKIEGDFTRTLYGTPSMIASLIIINVGIELKVYTYTTTILLN